MRAMGRIFEVRKHTMFARWNRMAKQFARIAKDITMAVKAGGTDPASNPTLRRVIQNARAVNMPKDKVEAAIKRAAGRDAANYQRGASTRATRRTASRCSSRPPPTTRRAPWPQVRNIITKGGGNLATNGSVSFLFRKMGVFRLEPGRHRPGRPRAVPHRPRPRGDGREHRREGRAAAGDRAAPFADFGQLQEALEARGITPLSAEHEYICTVPTELPEAQATEVLDADRQARAGRRRAEGVPHARLKTPGALERYP